MQASGPNNHLKTKDIVFSRLSSSPVIQPPHWNPLTVAYHMRYVGLPGSISRSIVRFGRIYRASAAISDEWWRHNRWNHGDSAACRLAHEVGLPCLKSWT